MRNYVILSLVCMCLGRALACRMSLSLDSQQQWVFGKQGSLGLRDGKESRHLCQRSDNGGIPFLTKTKILGCKWMLSGGVVTREDFREKLVITADTNSVRGRKLARPPLPSQLFIYVNGTLVNPSTGLLLTGASNRVQLEKPREGVKPQVVHLMNEQWYFIGGRVVSAWNGLVLTRKQGDNRLYILPPDQTDKSLHQKWTWGKEKLWNGGGYILSIDHTGTIASMTRQNRQRPQYERFSLKQGYIENTQRAGHVLYVTRDGRHVQFRKRHSY